MECCRWAAVSDEDGSSKGGTIYDGEVRGFRRPGQKGLGIGGMESCLLFWCSSHQRNDLEGEMRRAGLGIFESGRNGTLELR